MYGFDVPTRSVKIEAFRDLFGVSEIVGLGAVRQPFGEAQEAEIQVLLTPIVEVEADTQDVEDAQGLGDPVTSTRWLGCGQLDLLVAGSRWSEGAMVGHAEDALVEGCYEIVENEKIGEGAGHQPMEGQPFPSLAIASASGFLLKRVSPAGSEGKSDAPRGVPKYVLLPQLELLRVLFGVSSGFLLELFDGIRDPAVSGKRGLISRRHSRLLDDGTVKLVAGRELARDEALAAAAVIAVPELRSFHDSAFQQLSVDPEWRAGRPVHLNLRWPWSVPIDFGMRGRWIERVDGRRRFIASRVTTIGFPLSFRRVEVHHPGSKGGSEHLPAPQGRVRPANARTVVLTTGRAASTARRGVDIATAMVDMPAAAAIEVVSVPRGGSSRNDRGGIGEEPRDDALFGTGGRQPGADPQVGAARTKRRRGGTSDITPREMKEALEATWRALQTICRCEGWALDALPRSRPPSRSAPNGGLDLPNEPLVAKVEARGRKVLVVDRGSPSGDEVSLGILIPRDRTMSDQALAVAARKACTSICGRWRSPSMKAPDFRVRGTARGNEVWVDPAAYAELLRKRISSALDA